MERMRNEGLNIREKMVRFYNIEEKAKGGFFLQTDWLLENAVYPSDSGYAGNLMDLWNVYMPEYKFEKIILEYSKRYFTVLRYIHDEEIFKFNSVKHMQEVAIKNYVKYCISQGETARMALVQKCFDLLKDITDRARLYDLINQVIEHYFPGGEIDQNSVMFLKRFQDDTEQPYFEIVERLSEIHEHKEQALSAREDLLRELRVREDRKGEIGTLLNIMLCRLAVADGERRFSEVLENTWKRTVAGIPYTDCIYTFIEKYEKAYMNAACFGIKNIKDGKVIKQLYKDAVILSAVLAAIERGGRYGLREVNDFWKRDGMHFAKGYFFDDEYERMKGGFDASILQEHKDDVRAFHDALIEKIDASDYSKSNDHNTSREIINSMTEMRHAALNEKERQIDELQERISELEEKVESTEKEVLSQFISLLDSKKYDHVLGKLYRTAYANEAVKSEDIRRILKNLFEIMNISGIDIYGELGSKVHFEDIKRGKYRVDRMIAQNAEVKYPGYRIGNSVILHPLAEEV